MTKKLIQFNWRRQWSRRVEPHLSNRLVQASLDVGMTMFDPQWQSGDPPWLLGRPDHSRVIPGKLSWYQPWGCCHYIAFFSMAIGVLNYPALDWRFISGELHTVPVGFEDGEPRVVMDILLFDGMTAEASIEFSRREVANASDGKEWDNIFEYFVGWMVPLLRAVAEGSQERWAS